MSQAGTSHASSSVGSDTSKLSLVALGLGVLGVIGSLFTWGALPGGGFVWGLPIDVAALAVGVSAIRQGSPSRWASITGVVLAAAMIVMMVVWTAVGLG